MCQYVCVCDVSYLVAVHHEVVGGDKSFEDHHPAGVGCALKQRVRQLGNVHVHLIGAVDQIWPGHKKKTKKNNNKMREEEKLTQDNRTKSSDEKLLKITLTDTMPNYFSHREKKNADTQQGPTNRARISSEFLSERSLKDRCYPQNYFLSSFDSYSAAPLPSSLLSTS